MSNFVSVSSKLNLKLHTGQGSTGKAIYRTLSLSRISNLATASQLNNFASVLAGLMQHPVVEVAKIHTDRIED